MRSHHGGGLGIAVNATRLSGAFTGVARYLHAILQCWAAQSPGSVAQVVAHSPRRIPGASDLMRPWLDVRDAHNPLPPLVWENIVFPLHARRADVLLAPSFTMPILVRVPPTVLLVYDGLQAVRRDDFGARGRYLALPLMRASLRRADVLVTISEAAKADIVSGFGVDPERLHVVPGGVDDSFRPVDDLDQDRVRRAVGLDHNPYLLFVGKLSVRRNVAGLISAAGLLRGRGFPHTLVLVGYNSTGVAVAELAASAGANVVHVEGVTDDVLVGLYNCADAFVQAPFHETYSLPLIEAMACGTPSVTSSQPGLHEIGGDAPVYIDDVRPDAIADAVQMLLGDETRQAEARRAGLRRAESFRWEDRASRLADLCVLATHRRELQRG